MARKSRTKPEQGRTIRQETAWNAAMYLRLSVEDGDDLEQNSIGNQKKICLAHLEKLTGTVLVKTYVDNGHSGMIYNRPGFREMTADIESGKINCVIVKDISRFGRHYIITSEYLQVTFPQNDVRFIAVNDDYDSLHPNRDVEDLLLPFKMILNDAYAKDISQRIRSSISTKMNCGEFLPSSSSIPYGYLRNPERNTFDIDEEAAPIVRRLFELRAEGMQFNTIAKLLNKEGIPSPGKLRAMRGVCKDIRFANAGWIRGTIRDIVGNPTYIGYRIHGKIKRDRLGAAKTDRPSDEWQIIEGAHIPLVDKELFDCVQAVNRRELEKRSGYHKHPNCAADYRKAFSDVLYCGDCGSRMSACKRNQRLTSKLSPCVFYQCLNYQSSDKTKCSNHYTNQNELLAVVRGVMEQQVAIAADIEAIITQVGKASNPKQAELACQLQGLRVKRRNVEAKIERLLLDLTDGLLDSSEYAYTKERFNAERLELLRKERQAEQELQHTKDMLEAAKQWLDAVRHYQKMQSIDKALIDLMIKKISVYRDHRVEVMLNYNDPYNDFHATANSETAVSSVG